MQTYEFYATPKDGVIHIPDKYKDKIITNVKVIILEETGVFPDRNTTDAQKK